MNRQRLQTAGAVITLAMLGAGCAPFATYPPIEVTAGMAQPVYEPFPTLMARAIEYTRTEFCDESQELDGLDIALHEERAYILTESR